MLEILIVILNLLATVALIVAFGDVDGVAGLVLACVWGTIMINTIYIFMQFYIHKESKEKK